MNDGCLAPHKIRYDSRGAAMADLKRKRINRKMPTKRGQLRPYACGDHWHLTAIPANLQKKIRRSRRKKQAEE